MATKKDELDPTIETQQEVVDIPAPIAVDIPAPIAVNTSVPVYGVDEVVPIVLKYPTAFYIGSNIPYCKTCGEQYLTDLDGTPKCAEARPDCPRTNAHT